MDIAGLLESNMNKLQKTEQRLSLAKSMVYPSTYSDNMRFVPEIAEGISEHLSRIPYNQDVARRMRDEEENERMADYLDTLKQYGGKKKRKKTKKKKK